MTRRSRLPFVLRTCFHSLSRWSSSTNWPSLFSVFGVALLLSLISPEALRGQVPDASFAEIAQRSNLIVVATVQEQESQFNENETLITTRSTLIEPQVIHSEGAEQTGDGPIEMTSVGGRVDSLVLSVSGAPDLQQGQRYVLFKRDDGGQYFNPIVGRGRGLFQIIQDEETGTQYVLTSTGEAVLDVTAERVISSDRAVQEIQNGDPLFAEDTTENFQHPELPVPANEADQVQHHESEFPETGVPMTLGTFAELVQEVALGADVEDPVLRFEGQGSIYEREGEEIVETPISSAKDLGPVGSMDMGKQAAPKGQNLRVCGFQNLKITMEQFAPRKAWNNEAIGIWDRFMNIYNTSPDDGTFQSPPGNAENEFIGIVSQSTISSAYNYSWNGSLAVAISWRVIGLNNCLRIRQVDVAVNAAYNWTNDFSTVVDTPNVYSYRSTMMHELGHTWGYQTYPSNGSSEQYDYDEPSVMHGGWNSKLVEDGWGIHAPDAHHLRETYSGKTAVKDIKDVGVESYYADEGLNLSRTQDLSGSRKTQFRPGQQMHIDGLTVENMSNSAQPVILYLYLSKDRTINSSDHQLARYSWSSFGAETFQENDYTVTVPFDLYDKSGFYYVGARVLIPGSGQQDDFTRNNSTFLTERIRVQSPHTISGTIENPSGSALEDISVGRVPQGATLPDTTVETDGTGHYSIPVPHDFSGTIEPFSAVFDFNPAQASFSNVTGSQTQDFTATRQQAKISGHVTNANTGAAISNVAISGLPGSPTTDSQGYYEVTVDEGFEYTFTPSKVGYSFSPPGRTEPRLTGDETYDFQGSRSFVANSFWPQFQRDRARGAKQGGLGMLGAGRVLTGSTNDNVRSSPVVGTNGRVYVGSDDENVYAFTKDLSQLWDYPTGGAVESTPAVGTGGTIYVGSSDGDLYAMNRDGTLEWTFGTQGDIDASPVIGYGGSIYVSSADDSLYAVDPSGTKSWALELSGTPATPALGPDSNRVYVGASDGTMYAVDTTGTVQWSVSLSGAISTAPAVASDGNIYIGTHDNTLYALRPDGSTRWTYSTGNDIRSAPALGESQNVYVGSDDNQLHAVDSSGTQLWTFATNGDVRSSPAVQTYEGASDSYAGELVFVGSNDNYLYAVQATQSQFAGPGAEVWSHQTNGDVVSSPALTNRLVLVGSDDDQLYSMGHETPGGGGPGARTGQIQAVQAAMTPTPEEIYKMNRIARYARDVLDRFGDSGWGPGGGCGGGPLIIPACGGVGARYGTGTRYREVVGGGLHRFAALAPWVPREAGVLDRILSGETTEGLLGSFTHRFPPDGTSLAVLAGFTHPEQYPENPNGRSTALNLFVKEDALAESPDPDLVQVMAGHFVPDAPGMEITLQGLEEPLGALRYGDMTGYRALPPGQYVAVLSMQPGGAFQAGKAAQEHTQLAFPLDLTGKEGETVALLANGAYQAPEEPPLSIRAVSSDGTMQNLRNLEGSLAPGISSIPGLLEDDLLLDPGETERVSLEPQYRTAGLGTGTDAVRRLLPLLSSADGSIREATSADLPSPYEIPASSMSFFTEDESVPSLRAEMIGRSLEEMPDRMAELIESRELPPATHLSVMEASHRGAAFQFWLAMRTENDYAMPVASLLRVDDVEGVESASAVLAGYRPAAMELERQPISDQPFELSMQVDLRLQRSAGESFERVTEVPILVGNAGQIVSVDRVALGQQGEQTAHLEDPIHLRLDSVIFGIEGEQTPVPDSAYVVMNRALAKSQVSPNHELAAVWTGGAGDEGGVTVDRGRVHSVGSAERSEALQVSASSIIGADGPVSFGQTGVDVAFWGTEGSGTVTVQKFGNAPSSAEGIAEENVSSYRWVIEADHSLQFGPETAIRLDVSSLGGVETPDEVTLYKRSSGVGGAFIEVPTSYDSAANEIVGRTDSFSEFVVASDANPLPIELARFEASLHDGAVRLTWGTASETRNAGFEIERRVSRAESGTGGRRWTRVGFVEGGGTTTSQRTYHFTDTEVPYAADSLVYRLRQLDTDGSATVADSVRIRRGAPNEVRLDPPFPNPARGRATLRIALPERENVTLRVYDVLGRHVSTVVDEEMEAGRKQFPLNTSRLSSGTYFLRLSVEGTTRTHKFTVVK